MRPLKVNYYLVYPSLILLRLEFMLHYFHFFVFMRGDSRHDNWGKDAQENVMFYQPFISNKRLVYS